MKVTDYISAKVDKLPDGLIFSYMDVMKTSSKREATIKALNRMVASGRLAKLAKGKFYKAEHTVFGVLKPNQYEVVKDLLEENGEIVGYLTGYSVFNQLGLTTQVSNTIQIGKNDVRAKFRRGIYTITFIRQKNEITRDNRYLLQLLDAIRYIRKIPDAAISSSFNRILILIKELSIADRNTMVSLAIKYPPSTRALLGAAIEQLRNKKLAETLKNTLNPVTVYKLPKLSKVIRNAENWNIK